MHFNNDQEFLDLFNSIALSPIYQSKKWSLHVLDYYLDLALRSPGGYVECGVFRGFKSYFLLKKYKHKMQNREKYLFDTFEGIPKNTLKVFMIHLTNKNKKRSLFEFVKKRFSEFENTSTKGEVPLSFET